MDAPDLSFASLEAPEGERFIALRRQLGVESFGINLMVLEPGQRGRIHAHERQEEVYVVLEGELTLLVGDGEAEGEQHRLARGRMVRVGASLRRQLLNTGEQRLVLLALGGSGEHAGRDARAWESWEEPGEGRSPQEVPLPADLPR